MGYVTNQKSDKIVAEASSKTVSLRIFVCAYFVFDNVLVRKKRKRFYKRDCM